jgi:hypothetical protein
MQDYEMHDAQQCMISMIIREERWKFRFDMIFTFPCSFVFGVDRVHAHAITL